MWKVTLAPGDGWVTSDEWDYYEEEKLVELEYEHERTTEELIRFDSLGNCVVTTNRDMSPTEVVKFAKRWREAMYEHILRGDGTTYPPTAQSALETKKL